MAKYQIEKSFTMGMEGYALMAIHEGDSRFLFWTADKTAAEDMLRCHQSLEEHRGHNFCLKGHAHGVYRFDPDKPLSFTVQRWDPATRKFKPFMILTTAEITWLVSQDRIIPAH
jgi:hypothetical protein